MSHFGVHMYPYNNEVSLGNFNMPINNKSITLYRGSNTPLSFTIHNADGKYMVIADDEFLIFSIFDARSNTILFEQTMTKELPTWVSESGQARPTFNNKVKVYYGCVVPMGAIQDFSAGSKYRWSIKKVKLDNALVENSQYLYTGLDFQASADLIISNAAAPAFVSSVEISARKNGSWLNEKNTDMVLPIENNIQYEHAVMRTAAVRADAQVGLVDGLSTIAIYRDNFVGRYQLQGYLGNDSPDDAEDYKWFIIKLNGCEYIENGIDIETGTPIPLNGIDSYNFKGNFMWLRVVALIPPETVYTSPSVSKKVYNVLKTIPKILIRR